MARSWRTARAKLSSCSLNSAKVRLRSRLLEVRSLTPTCTGYPEDLHFTNYPDDLGSAAGDSITPSHSASQALSRTSSASSYSEDDTPYRDLTIPAPHTLTNGTLPELPSAPRRISTLSTSTVPRARSPPPVRPVFAIPTAPGPATGPSFDIPRAPANVSTRAPNDDSSDEEDAREFEALNAPPPGPRASMYRVQSPVGGRLHRQTQSETSSITDRGGGGNRPRRGSFFGGILALFKKKKSVDEPDLSGGWETRTDRHVFAATRGKHVGGGRKLEDESSEDDMPKNVVRVVNDPNARLKALSDVGTSTKPKLEKKRRTHEKAMSDIGVQPSAMAAMREFPTSTSVGPAASLQEAPVKKRKKKVSTATAPPTTTATTLVLSPNGEPYSSKPSAGAVDLSRSNTITTIGTTTTTGTVKRKRKKVVSAPPVPIPTAADLASSLPSARSNNTLYGKLDEPVQPEPHVQVPRKAPKSLAATETRGKKDHALYGNGNWVAVAGTEGKKASTRKVAPQGHEREESLMTIVEREANGGAEETSRKYGPRVPDKVDEGVPRPQSGLTMPSLVKRKSVRLAEGPSSLAPPPSHSPPSSIRSDPLSANSAPRHGILVNNGRPLSSANLLSEEGASGWDTRLTTGRGTAGADSSDEDEGYGAARRQFAKGTNKLESWIGGKGKGREV